MGLSHFRLDNAAVVPLRQIILTMMILTQQTVAIALRLIPVTLIPVTLILVAHNKLQPLKTCVDKSRYLLNVLCLLTHLLE
ncbi:MAG: hypothetical protein GY821_03290 [Gammaproteobacteria bacterium]|nr:hypothetical protein [Gammaproteobacteria bacterium]